MKKLALILIALFAIAGCNNLSPRDNLSPQIKQEVGDIKGDMATLENNQNAIRLELMRLQNQLEIYGENNKVQQGWFNFQGDGLVVGGFALLTISALLYYMYKSNRYERIAKIVCEEVRQYNDEMLCDRVMAAAWNTSVEKDVFKMACDQPVRTARTAK